MTRIWKFVIIVTARQRMSFASETHAYVSDILFYINLRMYSLTFVGHFFIIAYSLLGNGIIFLQNNT